LVQRRKPDEEYAIGLHEDKIATTHESYQTSVKGGREYVASGIKVARVARPVGAQNLRRRQAIRHL
jgi:hypothetical protein